MASLRELMETTSELERETMALYAMYAKSFAGEPALSEFWRSMAREEAGHVGALALVSTILEVEGLLDERSPIPLEHAKIAHLRALLGRERAAIVTDPPAVAHALAVTLEVEESEIEDQVGALLKAVHQDLEYERYQRLLVHDLSDLSFMIERYCQDGTLLSRCDELVERHARALQKPLHH